jgi:hypothetical protein
VLHALCAGDGGDKLIRARQNIVLQDKEERCTNLSALLNNNFVNNNNNNNNNNNEERKVSSIS